MGKLMNRNEKEEAQLKKELTILKAFREEELDDFNLLKDQIARRNICKITECSMKELTDLLEKYLMYESMHRWIKTTEKNREPMPKSFDELIERFRANPVTKKVIIPARNRKIVYSKKQRKQMQKWGYRGVIQ